MEAVFGGYVQGREWFFAIEFLFCVVSGAVSGVAQSLAVVDGDNAFFVVQWASGCAIAFNILTLVHVCGFNHAAYGWSCGPL